MAGVDIRTRHVAGGAVLYPGTYLNQLRGEAIERRCQDLLGLGIRNIVINFGETELINSIGISILLGIIEAVNEAEGRLVLAELSTSNRELFEMLGLMSHVRVENSEETALSLLSGESRRLAV